MLQPIHGQHPSDRQGLKVVSAIYKKAGLWSQRAAVGMACGHGYRHYFETQSPFSDLSKKIKSLGMRAGVTQAWPSQAALSIRRLLGLKLIRQECG